jgi:hypothetical protein
MRRICTSKTSFAVALAIALTLLAVPATAGAAWVWPVKGEVITPYRNGTDPYAAGQHRGIDIAAAVGTPVVAAAGGEVRFAGTAGTSGLTISIRTGDGYDTSYLHLASVRVRPGAHVSAGERIGAVGTTGSRSATAPHLHFGVRDAGTSHAYHDPLAFLPPPLAPAPNPPAPAPAPAPEPLPPATPPAPVPTSGRTPRAAPAPRGAPVPLGAPVPRGAPAPGGEPVPWGAPVPWAAPVRPGAPASRGAPVSPGAPVLQGAPASGLAPDTDPARSPAPLTAPNPAGRPSSAPGLTPQGADEGGRAGDSFPETRPGGAVHRRAPINAPRPDQRHSASAIARDEAGPDIGWALACGGLLLAAAILGVTGNGHRTSSRTTSRLAGALRPLIGTR